MRLFGDRASLHARNVHFLDNRAAPDSAALWKCSLEPPRGSRTAFSRATTPPRWADRGQHVIGQDRVDYPLARYHPTESLAAFDDAPLDGTWNLTVADRQSGAAGTLRTWCLLPRVDEIFGNGFERSDIVVP